jgi:hypothetical protein
MKYALKTKSLSFILLLVLICSSLLLWGCSPSKDSSNEDYAGTYKSIFVDSQNEDESISFKLVIKNNESFVLTKYYGDNSTQRYSGYYKTYTDSGKEQLLCIVEEGYKWNDTYPNAWNPYFSLCMLDDGTLMATAGTTSSSSSVATAFGYGTITKITLILFEKR